MDIYTSPKPYILCNGVVEPASKPEMWWISHLESLKVTLAVWTDLVEPSSPEQMNNRDGRQQ